MTESSRRRQEVAKKHQKTYACKPPITRQFPSTAQPPSLLPFRASRRKSRSELQQARSGLDELWRKVPGFGGWVGALVGLDGRCDVGSLLASEICMQNIGKALWGAMCRQATVLPPSGPAGPENPRSSYCCSPCDR